MEAASGEVTGVPGRTAILVVNGFDRMGMWGSHFDETDALRYPWIELCLRELGRRSRGSDYEVFVWDNSQMPELRAIARRHGATVFPTDEDLVTAGGGPDGPAQSLILHHAESLERLWSRVDDRFEYVMTLDTDAFPIEDGWLERLKGRLQSASLTGVWRDEMTLRLQPFVHPSCLLASRSLLLQMVEPFSIANVQDVGQRITVAAELAGHTVAPLFRSNARNAHFLIGGIYGDLVYHHAAGSRFPLFRLSEGQERELLIYRTLRDALFADVDHVIRVLRGQSDDDLGLDWTPIEPRPMWRWAGVGPRQAGPTGEPRG